MRILLPSLLHRLISKLFFKKERNMEFAVIYARYSCSNQTEQSIEGQLRVCEDFAQRKNIVIVDSYIDRATTGTNDKRPEFQKMIKDSAKNNWNYVIVYQLDRFARNRYDSAIYKTKLKANNVKVLSAQENILLYTATEDISVASVAFLLPYYIRRAHEFV
jgi:DNA invertase Pin-like site-specific DNA recombinase